MKITSKSNTLILSNNILVLSNGKYNWEWFTSKYLETLNKEKNPDIYGNILIQKNGHSYIADIGWETKEAYDRNGISVDFYNSDDLHSHGTWLNDTKAIIIANDYTRLQKRIINEAERILDIEEIFDRCYNLEAREKLEIHNFGKNRDLFLHIHKDEEYDASESTVTHNIVTISVSQNGKWVGDTEDTHVTDGSLDKELERIYYYKNFKTL